ncbi:uncharacterized protein LOC130697387 [Daphnia carinata]|uniref:uncharacterized protein LOC130697387 n=1 Tax=Daphnia carinata TaxID=120202 RepID=UPI00257993D5|nr:uncharacterized protein LOC130697387 [Daphnia carinata]
MRTILICYSVCVLATLFTSLDATQIPDAGLRVNINKTPSLFGRRGGSEWPEYSRMTTKKAKSLNLSSVVDKITKYISNYASSSASWLTYPYYGISTGVASMIVLFVVIYILIVVSGSVVTTTGRNLADRMGVDPEELDRLTGVITTAFNQMSEKLSRHGRSADSQPKDQENARFKVTGSGGPSWSSSITQYDSVSDYISANLYDKLIWLSKPYAGYILSMGAVILYMVVIVIIAMTSGVFPISTLGRQLHDSRLQLNEDANLARTAGFVMEAINLWMDARHNSLKED